MAHTPGPWQLERDVFEVSDFWAYIWDSEHAGTIAGIDYYPEGEGDAKANARLIAAAPELLEALQGLVDHYRETHDDNEPLLAYVKGLKAIAKATKG